MPEYTPQDWNPVVLRGKGKHVEKQRERNGETETQDKFDGTKSSAMRKLDDATDGAKIQRINPKIKTAIAQARTGKNLTQKELANRAQVQPNVLQQYETGKVKADPAILRKLQTVLGCKLMGKEFGSVNV